MESAKHDVWIDKSCLHVERGGLTIVINKGKTRVGTLKVNDTRICWTPKGKRAGKGLTWEEFNDTITKEGN